MPSSVPEGTVIMRRFSTCTSPEPWQVGQRSLGTFPLPRHTGQGIEKGVKRGDQYVEVRIELPEKLDPEQEAAAKAFAEKVGLKY